ncbi:restriction endonuclease subunit S, partial [Staphylococcus aureus]
MASDHVTHLKNNNLNKFTYLFIANMLRRLEGKYSFNREINDFR